MGIYDRDYYREGTPTWLSFPGQVCKALVVINAVVYVIQLITLDRGGGRFGLGPITTAFEMDTEAVFAHGEVWRLLTGAFLHNPMSAWHLVFNLIVLWMFGPDVEDLYGPRE